MKTNKKIVGIPYDVRLLNKFGFEKKCIFQPDIEVYEVHQPGMKISGDVNQPNINANTVYQPDMNANILDQSGMSVGTVYQTNIKARRKVYQTKMNIRKLITGPEADYGSIWNLNGAKIDKWSGGNILYGEVDMSGADLPSNLKHAIRA